MRDELISKILDEYLPTDGVGTEREKLRMNLHREFSLLCVSDAKPVCKICGYWVSPTDGKCLRPECDNY